jgi:hypothetical protein
VITQKTMAYAKLLNPRSGLRLNACLGAVSALFVGMLIAMPSAQAQLYQWRDATGRMVFSDSPPPPNIPPGNIIKRPKVGTPAPAAAPATADAAKDGAAKDGAAKDGAAKDAAKPAAPALNAVEKAALDKKNNAEAAKKAEEANKKAEDEKRRQSACGALQASATQLESGIRIRRINAQGEPYFIDDAERAKELQRIKSEMALSKC